MTSTYGDIDPGLKVCNILEGAPLLVVYGPPKAGKSTDVAIALNNCLFFTHDNQVLRPYASYYKWLQQKFPGKIEELGLRDPAADWQQDGLAIKEFPQFIANAEGQRVRQNTFDAFRRWLETKYCPAMKKGLWPFGGLVCDEWSTFLMRIFDDMGRKYYRESVKYGEKQRTPDHFTIAPKLKEFHTELAQIAQYTGAPLTLISHERVPVYNTEEDAKRNSTVEVGTLKYPGGPEVPHGKLINQICAAAGLVLRLRVTDRTVSAGADALDLGSSAADKAKAEAAAKLAAEEAANVVPWSPDAANGSTLDRSYVTEVSEEWVGGVRDFRINPREKLDLRSILQRCEFPIR